MFRHTESSETKLIKKSKAIHDPRWQRCTAYCVVRDQVNQKIESNSRQAGEMGSNLIGRQRPS